MIKAVLATLLNRDAQRQENDLSYALQFTHNHLAVMDCDPLVSAVINLAKLRHALAGLPQTSPLGLFHRFSKPTSHSLVKKCVKYTKIRIRNCISTGDYDEYILFSILHNTYLYYLRSNPIIYWLTWDHMVMGMYLYQKGFHSVSISNFDTDTISYLIYDMPNGGDWEKYLANSELANAKLRKSGLM